MFGENLFWMLFAVFYDSTRRFLPEPAPARSKKSQILFWSFCIGLVSVGLLLWMYASFVVILKIEDYIRVWRMMHGYF